MSLLISLSIVQDLSSNTVVVETDLTDTKKTPLPNNRASGEVGITVFCPGVNLVSMQNDMYLGTVKKKLTDPDYCVVEVAGSKVESYSKREEILRDIREILVGACTFLQAPYQVGGLVSGGDANGMILATKFSQSNNLVTFISNKFNVELIKGIMSSYPVEA